MMPTNDKRGCCKCRCSQSSPKRARAAGRNDASSRSVSANRSDSLLRPSSFLRSSLTTVCPAHNSAYQIGAAIFMGSPEGGSTLVISAPNCFRRAPATGPGAFNPRFTIFIPCSGDKADKDSMVVLLLNSMYCKYYCFRSRGSKMENAFIPKTIFPSFAALPKYGDYEILDF